MGIAKQVGKYRAAARNKNKNSGASSVEMSNAKQTARGGSTKTAASRGSWAGYNGGSSTLLQRNGAGYEATQKSRRSPRRPVDFSGSGRNPLSSSRSRSGGTFDRRYSGGKGSSTEIMKKQRALDRNLN